MWTPVFSTSKQISEIRLLLDEIANQLVKHKLHSHNPSLLDGNTGISIFFEKYFQFTKKPAYRLISQDLINSAIQSIENNLSTYTFCNGLAGIIWGGTYIHKSYGEPEPLTEFISNDVFAYLQEISIREIKSGNYDYLHGGLGYLLCAIDQTACGYEAWSVCDELLKHLDSQAQKMTKGISWPDGLKRREKGEILYNLGLAHGVPSIVVLLSMQFKITRSSRCKKMLEESIDWIMSTRLEGNSISLFPNWISAENGNISRLGWCYGDLGVSISLMHAATATANKKWMDDAIRIGMHSVNRRKIDETYVIDTPVCHGTTGIAHIFNRLYNYTGLNEFKEASQYWFAQTLEFYNRHGHFKYYVHKENNSSGDWQTKFGIIDGIAGIGLTLISAISDNEPTWDRALLLS